MDYNEYRLSVFDSDVGDVLWEVYVYLGIFLFV